MQAGGGRACARPSVVASSKRLTTERIGVLADRRSNLSSAEAFPTLGHSTISPAELASAPSAEWGFPPLGSAAQGAAQGAERSGGGAGGAGGASSGGGQWSGGGPRAQPAAASYLSRAPTVRPAWGAAPVRSAPIGAGGCGGGVGGGGVAPSAGRGTAGGGGAPTRSVGGSGGWAAAASRPAPTGVIHSVGRTPATEAASAAAGKTKGQKKAAARQRKAQAAAGTGGEEAGLDAIDAADAASGNHVHAADAAATSVSTRTAPPPPPPPLAPVQRPASAEGAKVRHRQLTLVLRRRLDGASDSYGRGDGGAASAADIDETMRTFKSGSSTFLGSGGGAGGGPDAAASVYLELFLSLFGSEGALPTLIELAALLPSPPHAASFAAAVAAKYGLASLPIADAVPNPSTSAVAPAAAPPTRPVAAVAAAAAATSPHAPLLAALRPAADSHSQQSKWVVASGPTFGGGCSLGSNPMSPGAPLPWPARALASKDGPAVSLDAHRPALSSLASALHLPCLPGKPP